MNTRLKELREDCNMTQLKLSTELMVSQETISSYENGKSCPSAAMLVKLSRALYASCDYILGISDIRYPSSPDSLNNYEFQILEKFRQLPDDKKETLLAYLQGLTER